MNSLSDFKARACTEGDVDVVFDFFKKMHNENIYFLPKEKKDIINKYRKYKDNSKKLNLFLLQDKNEKIIGCSGYVPFKGMLCGQNVDGFVGSDAIIDEKARRQFPMLAMLLAHSYEGLIRKEKLFPLACPANKVVSKSFGGVQWLKFGYIYKFTSDFAAKMIPEIDSGNIEFKRVRNFDREFKVFFDGIRSQYSFLLNTDIDFLNWKYFSNPCAEIVVLSAVKNKKIIGYVVAEKRYDDIHIVDLSIDLKYPSVILLLLFKSLKYFEIKDLTPITCCLSHKAYTGIFKRAGFLSDWQIECLFFKVGLLFSKVKHDDFYSLDRESFHFNGFAQHLY
jgi:hypothetical protein